MLHAVIRFVVAVAVLVALAACDRRAPDGPAPHDDPALDCRQAYHASPTPEHC